MPFPRAKTRNLSDASSDYFVEFYLDRDRFMINCISAGSPADGQCVVTLSPDCQLREVSHCVESKLAPPFAQLPFPDFGAQTVTLPWQLVAGGEIDGINAARMGRGVGRPAQRQDRL